MGRPQQVRRVWSEPHCRSFGPRDAKAEGDAVRLASDEFEALRLADIEGLYQDSAAKVMAVSRPTFARILLSARRKVARVLVEGKNLEISEGEEKMIETMRKFTCKDCGKEFEVAYGSGRPEKCALCGSANFNRVGGCGAQLRRRRNVNAQSAAGVDESGRSGGCGPCGRGGGRGRGRGCA